MADYLVGKELRITRDKDLINFESMILCPRCNKVHVIDDPQEIARGSLFCDTFEERIPFPEDKVQELMRLTTIKYDDFTEEKAGATEDIKGD